jgi:hypothetical protein
MSGRDWEAAFFAVGAVLGEPLESSIASVGEPTTDDARELVVALRSASRDASREQRARAIARTASQVAFEVEGTTLS